MTTWPTPVENVDSACTVQRLGTHKQQPSQRDLIKVLTILTLYDVMDLVVTALSRYPICRLDLLVVLLLRPYFRPT